VSGGSAFPTTRWSLILAARGRGSAEALATLCEGYWYPLYAFARRRGHDRDEALDLTQGFFAALLEKRYLDDLRPGEGRFRSFLLSALLHYISKERARGAAVKRGGGQRELSLDREFAERRYLLEPSHDWTPEKAYERSWACTILERVEQRLGNELDSAGKAELYRRLGPSIFGGKPPRPHRETARELGVSEDVVKMSVLRLRRRFGKLLREEVAQTVAAEADIDEEIRYLLAIVRSSG